MKKIVMTLIMLIMFCGVIDIFSIETPEQTAQRKEAVKHYIMNTYK